MVKQKEALSFCYLFSVSQVTTIIMNNIFKKRKTPGKGKKTSLGLKSKLVQKLCFLFLFFSRFAETVWIATFEFLLEKAKSVTFEFRLLSRLC